LILLRPIDRRVFLDKNKMKYFKNRLLEEKNSTMSTLKMMEDHQPTDGSMREYTEELSAYDNHPADLGTEMFMMTMQAALENHERYRITEIDRALEKIDDGTYGSCQLCGTDVPEERLEIMPEANICMECAKGKLEAHKLSTDRPVEEEVLSPSFRTNHKDYQDYTGFDGEDAYQAVAQFNRMENDPSFATGDQLGIFDDYIIGSVEEIENISDEYYRSQLPYTGDGIMDVEEQMDTRDI